MIHSYPSVYQLGHRAIEGIFNGPVTIEEKIDGSQFSFGIIDGELQARSKNQQIIISAPDSMFGNACIEICELMPQLHPGWVYRCEYLAKPKHNALAYSRVPVHHLIVYDIDTGNEAYMSTTEKYVETNRLGLEHVPSFFVGEVKSLEMFKELLDRESILGGTKIEGVVVKNYSLFTQEKKVAMGKYVSEAFKEKHEKEWGAANPSGKDVAQQLIEELRTEARWQKAVQHLRERGELDNSPKDIGALIREVPADILKEEKEHIMDVLFGHFWKQIARGVNAGLAEWYKEQLAKSAFEVKDAS